MATTALSLAPNPLARALAADGGRSVYRELKGRPPDA